MPWYYKTLNGRNMRPFKIIIKTQGGHKIHYTEDGKTSQSAINKAKKYSKTRKFINQYGKAISVTLAD